ncbi:transcription factor IIIB 50 kDa subunit isoform X2 [Carettochelys insculpta]|uniref:transcription factor IIIB 50 kDa subunit isoform X2 n=1 Tax=Carettochelys insculpta TaxID=44489 RepID=UPI003EC03EE0
MLRSVLKKVFVQIVEASWCFPTGIKRVQDLCKVLHLPAVFEDTALSYFQRAIEHPSFHLVSLEKKEILVGCCVFVTCRQHNWPLTMGTICSLLYADKELFASVYLSVLKELELDVPALSLTDLVKTHLNSFKLFQSSASIPAKLAEDKEKMVARTIQIVELASETWLVTGRHPIPIITAAAYLAWQSLQPVGRLTCTFPRFCKLAGTDLPPPAHLRLKELNEVLLRMASQLAWLRVLNLDKKTVAKHIGDLLQHRHLLLKSSFSSGDMEDPSPTAVDNGSERSLQVAGCSAQAEGCHAGGKQKHGRGQRPLLPPCLINPRKRLRTAALSPSEQAITGDEAISDSEIEQYLRSQEEVQKLSRAQAWH